ncbi:MAG: hypothetical protein H7Y01_03385 [Ferruginibacter sp.]|nr:hypothetical protein [Chitinophagaceae bacterium]
MAQWSPDVKIVESKQNDVVTVSGDLATGKIIEDLSWASNSANACFVATQNRKFQGNHVFFATTIPPHSVMNISVKPTKSNVNLSMYAYMSGMEVNYLVPDLPKCITCEADYKWDGNWKGKPQTSERKVEFNNPTDGPFSIVIGVTAPKGVTTGQFNLKIKVKS